MNGRLTRVVTGLLTAVAIVTLMSGCSLFNSLYDQGPPRDDTGAISETKVVPATTLRTGDCFSFLDDGSLTDVTAIPCASEHTYKVIGQGELTLSEVDAAGGMQNAVSSACGPDFDTFVASLPEGTKKPDLEFLVADLQKDGKTWSAYSCVVPDGAVQADG